MPDDNEPKKNPPSLGEMLWAFFGGVSVMLTALLLFMFLGDQPFGLQIAAVISYTLVVAFFTFSRTRFDDRSFSLFDQGVQKAIPRLLTLHCAFLVLILALQASFSALRPHLPSYWLREDAKHFSLFVFVQVLAYVAVFMTQVLVSRQILGRGVEAEEAASTRGAT